MYIEVTAEQQVSHMSYVYVGMLCSRWVEPIHYVHTRAEACAKIESWEEWTVSDACYTIYSHQNESIRYCAALHTQKN